MDQPTTAHEFENAQATAWVGGDERAYEALVVRYSPLIYARCRRILGTADADDATQAVFLVLARRGDQEAATPAVAAWLYAVSDNVIRNALRDRGRRQRAEGALPAPTHTPREEPDMREAIEHLDACVAEPEQMKALQAYQVALQQGNGEGWLMGGIRQGDVNRVQAGGFLALAATALIMSMAQEPAKLLQIAN